MSSESSTERPRRPAYMVVALTVCWLLSFTVVQNGYFTIKVANDPLSAKSVGLPSVLSDAWIETIAAHVQTAIPLATAQLLLGGMLLFVSSAILLGARLRLAFALQVLGANAALATLRYLLSGAEREALIGALVKVSELPAADGVETDALATSAYYWAFRLGLVSHVLTMAVAAHALTRPRARAFLTHVPQPGEER